MPGAAARKKNRGARDSLLIITQTALELGFLYALVAMALFLSYRILAVADLPTDGCFVLGAAVSVTVAAAGHPLLALLAAMLAGACAGFVTAFLQTKLGVPSILAGIVTNTGLYTVNLAVMGFSSNVPMLKTVTVFTAAQGLLGDAAPYKQFVGSSQFFNMQWGQVSAGSGDPALPNVLCSITHYKMLRRERS